MVAGKNYDLIFMDYHMPEMDGLEATRQIRVQFANQRQAPYIVALTASAMKQDVERCLQAGMDDFIGKPVALKEMARVIDHLCAQLSSQEDSKKQTAA